VGIDESLIANIGKTLIFFINGFGKKSTIHFIYQNTI